MMLRGQMALVTGASRGVGKGVAEGLAHAGATVIGVARAASASRYGAEVAAVDCDLTDDTAVAALFQRTEAGHGPVDILVNAAWGGYERMVEDGRFTFGDPFWEQPAWRWDAMMTARGGIRFRGHRPRGGYDGTHGIKHDWPTGAAPVL